MVWYVMFFTDVLSFCVYWKVGYIDFFALAYRIVRTHLHTCKVDAIVLPYSTV